MIIATINGFWVVWFEYIDDAVWIANLITRRSQETVEQEAQVTTVGRKIDLNRIKEREREKCVLRVESDWNTANRANPVSTSDARWLEMRMVRWLRGKGQRNESTRRNVRRWSWLWLLWRRVAGGKWRVASERDSEWAKEASVGSFQSARVGPFQI